MTKRSFSAYTLGALNQKKLVNADRVAGICGKSIFFTGCIILYFAGVWA